MKRERGKGLKVKPFHRSTPAKCKVLLMKGLIMKKCLLLTIALILTLGYGANAQAETDEWGGIKLCPLKPYRMSAVHADPDFVYLNPTLLKQWLQVQWINNGANTAYNVTATFSCYPPGVTSDDPTVYMGTIGPGASVWSQDDFTVIMDTTVTGKFTGPCWEITYKDAAGNEYRVTDIAKFCGEDCCEICDCTVIELNSFTAAAGNRSIAINWETATERNNVGFNILRAESKDGMYTRINRTIIEANGSPTNGASYKIIDTNVRNRTTYYYKLEDVDLDGTSTISEPISATPRLFLGIFNMFNK